MDEEIRNKYQEIKGKYSQPFTDEE